VQDVRTDEEEMIRKTEVEEFEELCYFSGHFRDNYRLEIRITDRYPKTLVVLYDSTLLASQEVEENVYIFFERVRKAYDLMMSQHKAFYIKTKIGSSSEESYDEYSLSKVPNHQEERKMKVVMLEKESRPVLLPPPPIPKVLPPNCASVSEFFERQVTSPIYNPVVALRPPYMMEVTQFHTTFFEILKQQQEEDVVELPIPPPPPLPVFFGPLTHHEHSLQLLREKRDEENRLRKERNEKQRKRNGSKIDKKAKAEHKRYNIFVKRFGLKPFPQVLMEITKKELQTSVLETSVSMVFKDIIKDVRDIILSYFIYLFEASRTNEERTEAESRHEGWTKTTKRSTNIASMQVVVSDSNTGIARSSTVGELPILMFVLTHKGFEVSYGQATKSMAVYFAIQKKDDGISARMTHSIPSAFRKVNQIGVFNKIVGYNSEPILARTYPHGLEIENWTVFRVVPSTVRGDQTHLLLWFTFFSADGFIACRPFTYAKKALRGVPEKMSSDIAQISQNRITICESSYSLSKIFSWIK